MPRPRLSSLGSHQLGFLRPFALEIFLPTAAPTPAQLKQQPGRRGGGAERKCLVIAAGAWDSEPADAGGQAGSGSRRHRLRGPEGTRDKSGCHEGTGRARPARSAECLPRTLQPGAVGSRLAPAGGRGAGGKPHGGPENWRGRSRGAAPAPASPQPGGSRWRRLNPQRRARAAPSATATATAGGHRGGGVGGAKPEFET